MTPYGQRIREYYLTHINPKFARIFKSDGCSEFLQLLQLSIRHESDKRISSQTVQASDTKRYIRAIDTPQDILDKLEMILGPVRLVIIAAENEEICTHHNIGRSEAERLQEDSHGIRKIRAEVWHKERRDHYLIDRGSREDTSQFSKEQIDKIIEPILGIYIERLEYAFFSAHADHSACIRHHEEGEHTDIERDYTAFIGRVLSDKSLTGSRDGVGDIADYTRAIDIARLVMSHYRSKIPHTADELFAQIDTIL